MTSIGKATPDDAKTLVDLILELAAYEKLLHEAELSVDLLRQHLSMEALTGCEALIAETDRGNAVGFALFQCLAEIAEERGCRRMHWAGRTGIRKRSGSTSSRGAQPLVNWTTMRLDEHAIEDVIQEPKPQERVGQGGFSGE